MNPTQMTSRIVEILKGHGATMIAIFGSYARGEETSGSDIDIITDFSTRKSLLDLVGIEQELSDEIGIKVDLLTESSISPYLIDRIRSEMKVVYG